VSSNKIEAGAIVLAAACAGAVYAWFVGAGISWDWRNYHDYSAYAYLTGRENIDVAVAGIQSYFNPLVYVPAYLLQRYLPAPLDGMALGALHGLTLALLFGFARLTLAPAANRWTLAAVTLIAAFSPMALSEVGTSFADITTAPLIVIGLHVLLRGEERLPARSLLAGMCFGAAAGLKLTNMVYGVGACAALLFAARPMVALPCFALGAAAGGLATGGAWAFALWQQFGNPLFPYYNNIFHSPDAPLDSMADLRFLPRNIWDGLAYPFYWLVGDHRSSEGPFRDPRFALAFALIAIGFVLRLAKRITFTRRDLVFTVFFLTSYQVWLQTFSIHRYAIALEILAAPLIVMLLCRLAPVLGPILASRVRTVMANPVRPNLARLDLAAIMTAALVALWSQPADWERRPWTELFRPALPAALLTPANYFLTEKPAGYLVPLFPQASRFYQLSDILLPVVPDGVLDRRIRAGLAEALPGGAWVIHLHDSAPRQGLLDRYGLQIDALRSCETLAGAGSERIEVCPLIAMPAADRLSERHDAAALSDAMIAPWQQND
jgi:hypothetical protein